MSAIWCLVSMYCIWILVSKLIRSNNQSWKTLWVLDTCLFVGLLLIPASLSSTTYNIAMDRKFDFKSTLSMWNNSELPCLVKTLVWFYFRVLGMTRCHRYSCADDSLVLPPWFWLQWNTFATNFQRSNNETPLQTNFQRSKAGIPSIRGPAAREIISASVETWETEVCFLPHPTFWHERMTPKNAQDSARCWFRVFWLTGKITILKQSQSTLLCCVSSMTILPEFTCVMNVRDQPR